MLWHEESGLIANLLLEYSRRQTCSSPLHDWLPAVMTIPEFLGLDRSATPPVEPAPAVDADGKVCFGEVLGRIRVRHPNGSFPGARADQGREP